MMTPGIKKRSSSSWAALLLLGQFAHVSCAGEDPGVGMNALVPPPGTGTTSGVVTPTGVTPGNTAPTGTVPGVVGTDGQVVPGVVPTGTDGAPVVPPTGTGTQVTPGTPAADEPAPAFTRRLTHEEFDNTINDLLGIEGEHSSALAADIAVQGFTNNVTGQNVTPTLAEQYITIIEEVSRQATANINGRLGCDLAALGEEACVQQFIGSFGKQAWRRPVTVEEQTRALELFRAARASYELDASVQMLVQYFLLSPHFMYIVEPLPAGAAPGSIVPLDGWRLASRLSYFLLGSMPDASLLAAAEAGTLDTPEGVAGEARRLLTLPRARQRIGLFFVEWLRLRGIDKLQKDTTLFPDFDLSMGQLLKEQVELFTQTVIIDEEGTAQDLLTAPFTFVNNRLASLYGVEAPAGSTMARVELDPTKRAGLLTHAAVLATYAHQNQTDPVTRGKFVRESILCDTVPAPPADLVVTAPEIKPGATTRERFKQHQEDPGCGGCHTLMDPIGLGFENFDPIGQWRDMDNGLAVDATGEIVGTDVAGTFNGAVELSQKLAASEQTMGCFAKTWLRFALGRSEQATDKGGLAVAGEHFEAAGFKMTELLVALAQTNTFRHQRVLDPNVSVFPDSSSPTTAEETP
jgi:hypothetical protein